MSPDFLPGGTGGIAFFTTRVSDRRKFKQEDKVLDRKEQREDKLREQESLYAAAQEFAQVCTEIMTDTVDAKGIFNSAGVAGGLEVQRPRKPDRWG